MSRPQDKHLIPLTERSEEEARAIRSAGGKAAQEKRKQQRLMTEMLQIYSGLPITDNRKKKRLAKMGIETEDLTQKTLIADALMCRHRQATPMRSRCILSLWVRLGWVGRLRKTTFWKPLTI